MRFHSYLISTSDPTLGLYLHVAFAWLHGHLPYVTAWEYKPPGFFALLALALWLSGNQPTLAVQGLATLATIATSFALWRLAQRIDAAAGARAGRYAALFFVLLSTEDEAFLGDAEILITAFIAGALLLAWRAGNVTLGRAALAGLLAGAALQIKLTALPLLLVPAAIVFLRAASPLGAFGAFSAGVLLPFGVALSIYAFARELPAFLDANVGATLRRAREFHRTYAPQNLPWLIGQLRILAPAIELAPFARVTPSLAALAATWGWLAMALLSVASTGEFFDRQFVLLQAPAAVLGGFGLCRVLDALALRDRSVRSMRPARSAQIVRETPRSAQIVRESPRSAQIVREPSRSAQIVRESPRVPRMALVLTMLVTFALHDYWQTALAARIVYQRETQGNAALGRESFDASFGRESYDRMLAALRALPAARKSLLLVQQSPLLYDEVGTPAPTRYAYTDHLLDARLAEMIGVDGRAEFARIFAGQPCVVAVGKLAEPRFDPATVVLVERRLALAYQRIAVIDARSTIYALRGSAGRCSP